MFVESRKIDLTKKYKSSEVAKLVAGNYGAEVFTKRIES
jgi:hypothetical protein